MNYYDVLGVAKTATLEEITVAKRRKARQHHPDKGGDPRAMVLVNKAYDTLSDPHKREFYDLHGEEEPRRQPLETMALQMIYNIILQLSEQVGDDFDFIEALKFNLTTNRQTVLNSEPALRKKLRTAERQRKTIRRKQRAEEPNNLLVRVFDQKIAAIKAKIEDIPNAVKIADECLRILADYEYAGEKPTRRNPLEQGGLSGLINQMMKGQM